MALNLKKILLENKKGDYTIAKLKANKHDLKPGKLKLNKINPSSLEEFGYSPKLTVQNPPIGENYPPIGRDYTFNKEQFAKDCLNNFINSLNILAEEHNAKYILLKNLQSKDNIGGWQISAQISYLR
jgi:hypothetical protein